jgi:RimJ/RimL family protein N-acetyltransferase
MDMKTDMPRTTACGVHSVQRVSLLIGLDNVASQGVATRARFRFESVLADYVVLPGIRRDLQLWLREHEAVNH